MNKFLPIVLISFLFSCSGEEDQVSKKDTDTSVSDITGIETLFNVDNFEDAKHLELLKELKICSEFQKDTSNYMEPACSPRFFRVFPMRDDAPVENAFLLQIKSKVGGIKLRRLVTFVREKGQLVKVNTFVANLIGTRTSKSHYKDLILRFNDNIEGEIIFYNCLFAWDGKKYTFKSVELIEGSDWRQRLKPEFKDSVSNDIYTTLVRNEMIL
ncbi:MAG: hypothetical protein RL679_1871 [Bacteroidota bacterium]|jgi:hypothetical protein